MGKTGTTNEFRDALFVGSTYGVDGITVAVRIGFDDNRTLGSRETGGRVALPVFQEVMRKVYGADSSARRRSSRSTWKTGSPTTFRRPPCWRRCRPQSLGSRLDATHASSRPRTGCVPADGLRARGRAACPRTGCVPADGLRARGRAACPRTGCVPADGLRARGRAACPRTGCGSVRSPRALNRFLVCV